MPLKRQIFRNWKGASEASANVFKGVTTFSVLKKLAAKTANFSKLKSASEASANAFKVVDRFLLLKNFTAKTPIFSK